MFTSIMDNKNNGQKGTLSPHDKDISLPTAWKTKLKTTKLFQRNTAEGDSIEKMLRSQIILFNSRKKWGLLFALATVSGLLCAPGDSAQVFRNYALTLGDVVQLIKIVFLPISTLLIITGMYVFNDLIDADLDRANGKTKRPIPSGSVSKRCALMFVIATNLVGIAIPVLIGNTAGIFFASSIALIGVLYSTPKISLKDRFIIKTFAISLAMMSSLLLGSSINWDNYVINDFKSLLYYGDEYSPILALLLPIFSGSMLAMMVFVTSPLNDLGDISGDRAAGRRTIPIVIGKENAVRLAILIDIGIAVFSWILFFAVLSSIRNDEIDFYLHYRALILPSVVSLTSILTLFHLINILKHFDDRDFVRNSVTKKSMPLHILLQVSLVIGCILF